MLNPTYCFTGKIVCGMCGSPYTRKIGKVKGKTYVHWICRKKKETGKTCKSHNFSEDKLQKICAEVLKTDSFHEELFENMVMQMAVQENGDIQFLLIGGETRLWKNSLLNSNAHIVTITECFQGKIICGNCGSTYHRVVSADKWVYWGIAFRKSIKARPATAVITQTSG